MALFGQGGRGWTPLVRSERGSSGGRGRTYRGGRGGTGHNVCRSFQAGHCVYGARCKFSHDPTNLNLREPPSPSRERTEENLEKEQARFYYNAWKKTIKSLPKPNDILTPERLWSGALTILDGEDQDWKQMLPRDLDSDEYHGREHIQAILSMTSHANGCRKFAELAQLFVSVISHPALLDCLSVDMFVGNLYNFISGSNGTRAIPFFKRLCASLVEAHFENPNLNSTVEVGPTLITMSTALCELLRRVRRATFNDDLPNLVDSLKDTLEITSTDKNSTTFSIIVNRIAELGAMIARANGLLYEEEAPVNGASTNTVASTYPREMIFPGGRHDNDKMDMTKIKILPTEDEIRSNHPEFLPSTNPEQPHFLTNPVDRHLDTHFRLLRYDIFGELKETLGILMTAITDDPDLLSNNRLGLGNIRAYLYHGAHIRHVTFDQRHGLETHISFPQPIQLRKKSPSERRTWWEESRRLEEGILLCFISLKDGQSSILLFTVSRKCTDPKQDYNLSSNNHQSTITARLATWDQNDTELMIQLSCQNTRGLLIEFPGILLATFIPILENLQDMQQLSRLPFRQWVLPDRIGTGGNTSDVLAIPPPLYSRKPNFSFSLKSILKDSNDNFFLSPETRVSDIAIINELETRTHLDRGQCQALMAALLREFAFIQGPPGTGKSYLGVQLMRVLLSCRSEANLGPIIVVCYTNHALDQFLEHLIKMGIDKIIRIGGQSQSKVLEGKNLRIVSKDEFRTKSEGYLLATTYKELEQIEKSVKRELRFLQSRQKRIDWQNIRRHLQSWYPRIHAQFSSVDDDGFKAVGRNPFDIWASKKSAAEPGQSDETEVLLAKEDLILLANQNAHRLSSHDRSRLVEYWTEEMCENAADRVVESIRSAEDCRKRLSSIHDEVDRRVLQTADVIGVTTTGLAKRIATLKHIRCKVVICEEAGEVMEPHMLSALLPSIEHLIQIGDHQQLRPQINNFGLSLESQQGAQYQLDRSQFERLSVGECGRPTLPVAQLNVQRRMRPEISTLIRETIYPSLTDHETTKSLPNVIGMRKNVFWLDHDNMEEDAHADMHQKSHSNSWEVEFTQALVRHIVRQGSYRSSQIAVLTPYTGQLQKLRAKMRNDFEIVLSERDQEMLAKDGFNDEEALWGSQFETGKRPLEKKKLTEFLRISTCDNFQGEESQIVIISLVRSNKRKRAGFLKTTNRINVLLSRAQHGMYIIGNVDTYSDIPMWAKVLGMLQATESIGKAIGLCCPRHPDIELQASQPDDFARISPEGGCQLPCDRRLPLCGHRCQAKCHSDKMHQVFACPQPCQRLHSPCNHSCQKATCGEDCGVCLVKLNNVILPCLHSKDNVPCYQTQDAGNIKCNVLIYKQVPDCGHVIQAECRQDVTSKTFRCPTPCGTDLPCGHRCQSFCGSCNQKDANGQPAVKHGTCMKVCGRPFATCNHTCQKPCHDGKDCGPCLLPCQVICAHSHCDLLCHEACSPCIESCTWSCEHKGACSLPCAAPCARLPCNRRCTKKLSCDHQCPSICGEICPEGYCQTCAAKDDTRVDLLEMKTYGEINLDETPIVVLGCGHFFTAETLDGHMGMGGVYLIDEYGEFIGLKDISAELARKIPRCPDCQSPVRQHTTRRYNRVINRAVIDEISKRFVVNGQDEIRLLKYQAKELEDSLETTLVKIKNSVRITQSGFTNLDPIVSVTNRELVERHEKSRKLQKAIQIFCQKVTDKHKPTQKLHDATVHAIRRRSVNELMTNLTIAEEVPAAPRDNRITLYGRVLQIQVMYVVLKDKFSLLQVLNSTASKSAIKFQGGGPHKLARTFFQTCKATIDDCIAENLPKLSVEASIYYARMVPPYESYCHLDTACEVGKASEYTDVAQALLEKAKEMCAQPFQDADSLLEAVVESINLLQKEWYEEVTAEEIAAIKIAMISGPGGISTHSGHWYNCANGHPFAIGECGMPMEMARCPECGAPVGGEHHQVIDGVTRAINMED